MYFPTLQNHFVSYETIGSPIDNSIRIFQASSQIISIQDGDLSGLRQSLCTHHADISIRDRQNTCTTEWGSWYLILRIAEDSMSGKERNQMFGHTDRTYSRTSATMRGSECFMKIQVADIRTDESRIGQSHLGIHIGSIHIYLCATGMNDVANFLYFCFEDTMCRRISNHQRCQFILIFFSLGTQVIHFYISLFVACTGDGHKSGLYSWRRICSVSWSRNQDFVPMSLTDTFEISTDYTKSCIFSRSTRIGLQAHPCKSGDNFQIFT